MKINFHCEVTYGFKIPYNEWWKYVYDKYCNCLLCPVYQVLTYHTTNQEGCRGYKSDPDICAICPTRWESIAQRQAHFA